MLDIYYKTTKSDNFKKIKSIRDGVWINVENAQKEDLEEIVKLTDLDYADLQDSLDPYELPRIERHEGSVIIFMRNPQDKTNKDEFLYTQLLTIVISNKYFITISISKNKVVESILDKGINFATTQRARLLIYILLQIAQKFTKEIKFVKNKVLSQKKHIKNIESSDIVNLIENEEILNQYTSSLSPMKSVFKTISKGKYIYLYEYDEDSLQDMIISMNQSVDLCDVSIKSIQSLRDSYQIIFTNRLNKVMKFLTSFTIIMTIPTIVASIYGMNVGLPLSGNPFAFWYIMIISFGISLIFVWVFFRKRWL
jgi:magnesium transporter